ncbi:Uncharacterised protein [Mycobacteroides abscessus subsp. abscessus]|nr:Uncharacterised protein [Mycobacteroides abscessus subsp. abscessus]
MCSLPSDMRNRIPGIKVHPGKAVDRIDHTDSICTAFYRCFCCCCNGTCPDADPIPLSAIPCGQPKLSSSPSTPISSTRLTISCHFSCFGSTISEAMIVLLGNFFFVS